MPRKTERQMLLEEIDQALILRNLNYSSSEDENFSDGEQLYDNSDEYDNSGDDFGTMYVSLRISRYLEPRERVAREPERLDFTNLTKGDLNRKFASPGTISGSLWLRWRIMMFSKAIIPI